MDHDCSIVSMDEPNSKRQLTFGNADEEDRLSKLPDAILITILSRLPIQYAVVTGVLSRRWSNLWTFITAFHFDGSTIRNPLEHGIIINHIFSQLQSPQIRTFDLQLYPHPDLNGDGESESNNNGDGESESNNNGDGESESESESESDEPNGPYLYALWPLVESWIRLICSRKVQHVKIEMLSGFDFRPCIPLPSCLFESKTLKILVLRNIELFFTLPQVASLPKLETLSLFRLTNPSQYPLFCKLINESCPRLEMLCLNGLALEQIHIDISSHKLKTLFLRSCWNTKHTSVSKVARLDINAPNLEFFTAYFPRHLVMCKFPKEPTSVLREAYLAYDRHEADCSIEVFRGIHSVRKLVLNHQMMDAVNRLGDDSQLPTFSNLIDLSCTMLSPGCWKALLRFLHRADKMQFLAIRIHRSPKAANRISWVPINYSMPPISLQHVKVVKISLGEVHAENEMELMKYLLYNATALEELTVKVPISKCEGENFQQQKESELHEYLSKLCTRSSSLCQIQVTHLTD